MTTLDCVNHYAKPTAAPPLPYANLLALRWVEVS